MEKREERKRAEEEERGRGGGVLGEGGEVREPGPPPRLRVCACMCVSMDGCHVCVCAPTQCLTHPPPPGGGGKGRERAQAAGLHLPPLSPTRRSLSSAFSFFFCFALFSVPRRPRLFSKDTTRTSTISPLLLSHSLSLAFSLGHHVHKRRGRRRRGRHHVLGRRRTHEVAAALARRRRPGRPGRGGGGHAERPLVRRVGNALGDGLPPPWPARVSTRRARGCAAAPTGSPPAWTAGRPPFQRVQGGDPVVMLGGEMRMAG